jgi:hypothetical protein
MISTNSVYIWEEQVCSEDVTLPEYPGSGETKAKGY